MAISQEAAIKQIAALVRSITGLRAVYSSADSDANALPAALNGPFPCAIVYPGDDIEYILTQPHHRHTYQVTVQLYQTGQDVGQRAVSVQPFIGLVLAKLALNVTGSFWNSCVYERSSGLSRLEYAGLEYTGFELTLKVSEEAVISAAAGV